MMCVISEFHQPVSPVWGDCPWLWP